jgi:general secretion pathway protein K
MPINRHKRGSALLTVLWLTAALSAIGLAVANNVRGETARTATSVDDLKSWFIARGALEQAALHIKWRGLTDAAGQPLYFRPGQPVMNLSFPDAEATVEVIPENSKLNPNTIRPEDLLRLLEALRVPEDRATEITSAIVDWRTPVNPMQPSPLDAFYLSQSPSFLPRHASFQENEELLLVKGMTPALYYGESLDGSRAGLRDCLSVYGTNAAVDVNTATPATLQAVGLTAEDAQAIAQRRAIRPIADYAELFALQQELGLAGQRLRLGGGIMYTLRATARLKQSDGKLSDLRRTVAALVDFDPKSPTGDFQILRWFDRT